MIDINNNPLTYLNSTSLLEKIPTFSCEELEDIDEARLHNAILNLLPVNSVS